MTNSSEADEEQAQERRRAARDLVASRWRGKPSRPSSSGPGSSGLNVRSEPPVAPAAMATTIVSPMAREMPRIKAATMPETAAGMTTRDAWS